MKLKSYHILYRIFCTLSDKTGGFPLFVKYKLLLGTLILTLSAASCAKKSTSKVTDEEEIPQVMCYEPTAPMDTIETVIDDTVKSEPFIAPVIVGCDEVESEAYCYMGTITCYDIVLIDTIKAEEQPEPSTRVYDVVEQMPVPVQETLEGFMKWVNEEMNYPRQALEKEIGGRVVAKFVVDTIGDVTDIIILRGLGSGDSKMDKLFDDEVIRVISASPRWQPGVNRGKLVNVAITVPVRFKPDMITKEK